MHVEKIGLKIVAKSIEPGQPGVLVIKVQILTYIDKIPSSKDLEEEEFDFFFFGRKKGNGGNKPFLLFSKKFY